jgi:hypothetical protein
MVGSVALIFLFIIPYSVFQFKNEEYVKGKFIYLIAAFTWLMLFTMLLALNVESSVIIGFDHVDEKLQKTQHFYESKNNEIYADYIDSTAYSSMQEVKKDADELVLYLHDLKLQILRKYYEGEEFPESSIVNATTVNLKHWESGGKSNTSVPHQIMMSIDGQQGKAAELKFKIEDFKNRLLLQVDNNADKSKLIGELLKTEVSKDTPEWLTSWEEYCFKKTTIVACINVLSSIQRDVRIAESEALSYLVHNH